MELVEDICNVYNVIFSLGLDVDYGISRDEIHKPLLSHFSLLVQFFIGKVQDYNKDSRVLRLVNLTPVSYR